MEHMLGAFIACVLIKLGDTFIWKVAPVAPVAVRTLAPD